MKKIFLTMMMVFCLSQINAQVKFGLKGGVNYAGFKIKEAKDNLSISNSSGWQAGALLQATIPVIKAGVQPELLYTVVKGDVSGKENSIHYFQVPVNIRKSFLVGIRPFIEAGPYFSYAVKRDGEIFKDKVEKFDWGIGLGAGIEIWKFQFGARYSWGLQDVGPTDFKLKNNTFSLSLAILL